MSFFSKLNKPTGVVDVFEVNDAGVGFLLYEYYHMGVRVLSSIKTHTDMKTTDRVPTHLSPTPGDDYVRIKDFWIVKKSLHDQFSDRKRNS